MQVDITSIQTQFFSYLFGKTEGYLCLATSNPDNVRKGFKQDFFHWPDELPLIQKYIELQIKRNLWFSVSLFDRPERRKENCLPGSIVWADFDETNPSDIEPRPPCIIESSPNRYQAIWRLEETIPPDIQEDYAKRVAYALNADKGCWNLGRLLRVPFSYNFKYRETPRVELVHSLETRAPIALFEALPLAISNNGEAPQEVIELPELDQLPQPVEVLYKYKHPLTRAHSFFDFYLNEPEPGSDWSRMLWRLINVCFESGMSRDEVFVMANSAACNKYHRDNRPLSYLWREVLKAEFTQSAAFAVTGLSAPLVMPQAIKEAETTQDHFIADYKRWACQVTDAVEEYHELSAFILLSSVLSTGIKLRVDWGELIPNLWGLVLGESTLTRKTTAMRMAMDMVAEIDPDMILATDGSPEGLLTGLSARSKQTSIFYKDEITGFFDSINRKDYLAGMPEILTQLYDVPKIFRRMLRKEVISITEPYFIFFGGGIRDKVFSLLTDEYILSGFLPRFLIVSGESDLAKVRRTGPPTESSQYSRSNIVAKVNKLYNTYNRFTEIQVGGQVVPMEVSIEAKLTEDAWTRYGILEDSFLRTAHESTAQMLALPTFTRLAFSTLKMAVLLGAARNQPSDANTVTIEEEDIVNAAWYIQKWGRYSIDIINNTGKPFSEKMLDKVYSQVQRKPGVTRAEIMRNFHLLSRDTNEIIKTLEERGMVNTVKEGRGFRVHPVE